MPHRSRKSHNLLIFLGGAFAFLLILSSFLISQRTEPKPFPIRDANNSLKIDEGFVAGAAQEKSPEPEIAVDVSKWKNYRDPVYHFELKYPSEWAEPVAKKISDPDFDYEYQVSFGTAETLAGANIEGFTIYVFRSEKCDSGGSSGTPKCATQKTKVSTDTISAEKIFEFSSKSYSYTIVPFIPESGIDPNFAKKVNLEIDEAQKSFSIDPNLKIIAPSPKPAVKTQPPVSAPAKQTASSSVGRAGKLTGAKSSGGRLVCPHPGRKPQRSPNKGNHVDEDCCPDPDEYPNRACAYKPSDFAIMLH